MKAGQPIVVAVPKIEDPRGNLSFIQHGDNGCCPFEPQRVYWIYDVPGGRVRHGRALRHTAEMIVAMSGSFVVRLEDREGNVSAVTLTRSDRGVVVPPMTWRELTDFSTNSVAMVLASSHYDAAEYIEDHNLFTQEP